MAEPSNRRIRKLNDNIQRRLGYYEALKKEYEEEVRELADKVSKREAYELPRGNLHHMLPRYALEN